MRFVPPHRPIRYSVKVCKVFRACVSPTAWLFALGLPLAFFASLGPPAQAQYPGGGGSAGYSVSYAGGGWSTAPDTGSGGYGPTSDGDGYSPSYPQSGTGTVSAAGAVTATLAWGDPSRPPPPALIVQEDATASWSVEYSPGGGACDCGLPNATVTANSLSGTSTAVRYTPYSNPGASLTLPPVSPSARAGGQTGAGGYYTIGVGYRVTPYPITIQLTGTTKDSSGGENILIGQHCGASLSGLPGGTGWTIAYQWSVSGPTFQSWTVSTDSLQSSTTEVDGPGDLTIASPGWCWHEKGNNIGKPETVSCTATVTPPSGQGTAFTVTATKQITVWVPKWTATGTGGAIFVGN